MTAPQPWWLYVIECRGGSLYAGISPAVEARYAKHAAGKGAKYTQRNPPQRLLAVKRFANRHAAAKAEVAFKRLRRTAQWQQLQAWSEPP